jgi:N-acetylmuramoyl-L-alanine amidase
MAKRTITDKIVVHCSATKPGVDIGVSEIREWHLARKFSDVGYHFVIRRNGRIEPGRDLQEIGAHAVGHNSTTVAVCMVGGLDAFGKEQQHDPAMFTDAQWTAARKTVNFLREIYPDAKVCGHRDLSPDKNMDGKITPNEWLKSCPGFDAALMFGEA